MTKKITTFFEDLTDDQKSSLFFSKTKKSARLNEENDFNEERSIGFNRIAFGIKTYDKARNLYSSGMGMSHAEIESNMMSIPYGVFVQYDIDADEVSNYLTSHSIQPSSFSYGF